MSQTNLFSAITEYTMTDRKRRNGVKELGITHINVTVTVIY
jgi:hypothetical protein